MHSRSKQWYLNEYAICHRKVIREAIITREMPGAGEGRGVGEGAECWTDHRLVKSVLSLHISLTRHKTAKSRRPAFDTAKMKQGGSY